MCPLLLDSLDALDTGAVARALALVAGPGDEIADVYYERRSELALSTDESEAALRRRHERGLAARLVRAERSWLASRDDDSPAELQAALRAVARALPAALPSPEPFPEPSSEPSDAEPVEELRGFPAKLERALRKRLVAFPYRLELRRHERVSRVVTTRMASPVEREIFASVDAAAEFGRCGELATRFDDELAERFAERLAVRFRARSAPPPPAGHPTLLFAPAAAAVALHEAVGHALEADLLALSGNPSSADGILLGPATLDVLDDPTGAPGLANRTVDDEGVPCARRWLVRAGRVAQPLADLRLARKFGELLPGSGFRADRHAAPLPRMHHLELFAGDESASALLAEAEGGLAVGEIESGTLDAATGRFTLAVPGARRIRGGELVDAVGRFTIRGKVGALLGGLVASGARREAAGAGWCAKAAQRRAVWATVPALVVAGLEVAP